MRGILWAWYSAKFDRMDILDKAFISRFPIKQEMKPFSREESICMVQKFLDNIQYGTAFSDTEIQNLIGEGGDQRQIMNYTIQALAEKIAEKKIMIKSWDESITE